MKFSNTTIKRKEEKNNHFINNYFLIFDILKNSNFYNQYPIKRKNNSNIYININKQHTMPTDDGADIVVVMLAVVTAASHWWW